MDHIIADQLPDGDEADRIIAAEFDRLRESALFTRSPVLSRLLQFLVEHRLRGGRSAPKASSSARSRVAVAGDTPAMRA